MSRHLESTPERSYQSGRRVGSIEVTAADVRHYLALQDVGINLSDRVIQQMIDGLGLDAADGIPALNPQTSPSITTPVQFLQAWLPGFVRVLTAARKIDVLVGISTAGSWEDHSVVQGVMEGVGVAEMYTDHGNLSLASWNANFVEREIVRGESGIEVGRLEEARAARIRVNTAAEKRTSATLALDILRNRIGFVGYNEGNNRTYGFLNDPELLPYETVAAQDGHTMWRDKDFQGITGDLRTAAQTLRIQGQDNIDPAEGNVTLALPTNVVDYLSVTTDYGQSVRDWISKTYPNWRIESCPEFQQAHGSQNVFYLYAESVDDGASDDSRTFVQVVPTKFQTLGVAKDVKTYREGYTNATAGTFCKRPFATVRFAGI